MLTAPVADTPVIETVASASIDTDPTEPIAAGANTIILLDDRVVTAPTALVAAKPDVIITVASASINTETFPKVAVIPLKETFASPSGVTVPKAEVPT